MKKKKQRIFFLKNKRSGKKNELFLTIIKSKIKKK